MTSLRKMGLMDPSGLLSPSSHIGNMSRLLQLDNWVHEFRPGMMRKEPPTSVASLPRATEGAEWSAPKDPPLGKASHDRSTDHHDCALRIHRSRIGRDCV